MAEPASAVIALIAVSVKTCKILEAAISAIKDAPTIVKHWRTTGRTLQASLVQLEDVLKRRIGAPLPAAETELHEALKDQLESFQRDLDRLQNKIPEVGPSRISHRSPISRFRDNAFLALRNELQRDESLFARLNQHVSMLQLSVSLLSL